LISDGIGFVGVSEAQVSVKEKFFQRGRVSYKARSSDGRFARAASAVLGKYRLETAPEEQHSGMASEWPQ
jgi:hypothetical protein